VTTTTVWIYQKADTLRLFDSEEDAREWLAANDPQGEAIEHHVSGLRPAGSADRYGVHRAIEGSYLRLVK
jgi:hypothetical protein